jgi:hypothetical protein
MLEFSSISVSTYDSASLAERLTERSAEGWDVVSIVQTGTTVTAFISRPLGAVSPVTLPTVVESTSFATTAGDDTHNGEGDPAAAATPAATTATATTTQETVPQNSGTEDADSSVGSASASSTSSGAAPAGWYADPASRFELRYWDGDKWTEYVSRQGQQFTDPPVA